ncbi:PilZ domain-containing protein [Silvanigrella aquatica]|uniref:PilZ domain-containing protein n=1 Tax=Silvanigrella aquatica TaxID=1915309 RepID=A0A1L4CXM1_9BACT|nr:PilZ domain-containing protein [Silvanigrella aquatica]APJ02703.1 hypothetical protein AXG55_01655 [Silvanigrella aquatica]
MEVFDSEGKSIFDITPKKKKRYVLFVFKLSREDESRIRTIEKAIQHALPEHVLIRIEDPNEGLKALLVKNIEIIFVDSSIFGSDKVSVEYGLECKKRKKCPIFFIAQSEETLIQEYRKTLALYEEFDDYFNEPIDFIEISKKLKRASLTLGRRARRFSLDIPITVYRLNNDKLYNFMLSDLSLVGFGIKINNDELMNTNEQVKIKLPLSEFKLFHPQYGEFLPLSGRVRRISIDGKIAGCSIEHMTPMQIEVLMNLLEKVSRRLRMARIAEKPIIEKDPVPV